jgi:hypothetical protein
MGKKMRLAWVQTAAVAAVSVALAGAGGAGATAPGPFGILANSSGWAPRGGPPVTVLVGDSLIWGLPAQSLAERLSATHGRDTWVAASAGASTKIDWAAHSAGQESWFAGPQDIHHSVEGKWHYAEFINRGIHDKIKAGLC